MVFVKNESDFVSVFPGVPYIGELGFGFGGSDAVRLYSSENKLVDEVYYESESPWPTCANETGNTLELITPDLDNLLPESWSCINENGSPNAVNSTGLSVENKTFLDGLLPTRLVHTLKSPYSVLIGIILTGSVSFSSQDVKNNDRINKNFNIVFIK